MGLGKRKRETQGTFWVPTDKLGSGPRNVFYDRLNGLLAEIDFDSRLEEAAAPYYETTGRKGLAPGVYFRMLFIGYFEGIDSQRGIAWRCDDSRSLARFLGFGPGEETPDHSTLTLTRNRLPLEIHQLAFDLVLGLCHEKGLLKGKTLGVDASDLEANASIVRRDSGDDWQEYVRKLYEAETGVSDPDDEELRRFDRKRKKKVSNDEWVNPHDPDARNLGRILRQLLGAGKPKQFGDLQAALSAAFGPSSFAYFAARSLRTIVRISIAVRLALLMTRRSATF